MSDQPMLEPAIIVIFGVTGDLAQRYLLPALYHLFKDNLLHEHTEIIGLTRQNLTAEDLFEKVELCVNEVDKVCDPVALKAMQEKTHLLQFDPNVPEDYAKLLEDLNGTEEKHGLCLNRLYYLSIPPSVFTTVVHNLGEYGLNRSCQHGKAETRLLVEKPFGYDLLSAKQLINKTAEVFNEDQVFRIDHYLAKETVQNILTFRSYNPIFASVWDRHHIRSIEITAAEKIGIEGRVNFYEGVGALRDLVQSHLLQLLALVTMELPSSMDSSEAVHAAKHELLKSVHRANPGQAVRAQYATYRNEVENPDSTTETYARLQLSIDNHRWNNVPITITTGKALQDKRTEISVIFANPNDPPTHDNILTFRIQPNEGIHLQLCVKKPSFAHELEKAVMDFSYKDTFTDHGHPDAYERVLVDAVRGDHTLFATSDEVLLSWKILEKVLESWQGNASNMLTYQSGTAGPKA
jgi:glucose-6-phosphate 1-dehydrogenase